MNVFVVFTMPARPTQSTPVAESFGAVIRRQRKALRLTQAELANRIVREEGGCISMQYIHNIEAGIATPSSHHLLLQLSEVLSIELDYLYYLAGVFPVDICALALSERDVVDAMNALRGVRHKTGLNRK